MAGKAKKGGKGAANDAAVYMRVTQALHDRLEACAAAKGMPMTTLARMLIVQALPEEEAAVAQRSRRLARD